MGEVRKAVVTADNAAKQKYQTEAEIAYSNDDPVPEWRDIRSVGALPKIIMPNNSGPDFRKVRNAADGMSQMVAGEQRLSKGDMALIRSRQTGAQLLGS